MIKSPVELAQPDRSMVSRIYVANRVEKCENIFYLYFVSPWHRIRIRIEYYESSYSNLCL